MHNYTAVDVYSTVDKNGVCHYDLLPFFIIMQGILGGMNNFLKGNLVHLGGMNNVLKGMNNFL